MTNDERDESVRRAFQELRDEDQRALPRFERTLAGSSGKTAARDANHRAVWLAAASVLVVGGVGLIAVRDLERRPSTMILEPAATELVAWESPTARLLLTTGRGLTKELPRIGVFDLDSLDPVTARTKEEGSTPLRR